MKLNKSEKMAAMAVLTAAAAVAGVGVRLAKKQTELLLQKAASTFKNEEPDEDVTTDETGADAETDA